MGILRRNDIRRASGRRRLAVGFLYWAFFRTDSCCVRLSSLDTIRFLIAGFILSYFWNKRKNGFKYNFNSRQCQISICQCQMLKSNITSNVKCHMSTYNDDVRLNTVENKVRNCHWNTSSAIRLDLQINRKKTSFISIRNQEKKGEKA